ncbi:cytosolic carboxypeptidase 1-like [Lytechinus variegatus]|uniref:cytosolic carboxypeptidase 1-like n=1 Tax=Lytechinus variegatus TaxID=7654 RepID=UPI001BB2B17A|nr:cytosolic carboxypeptidase 1-like [Lytechinus variegatus]
MSKAKVEKTVYTVPGSRMATMLYSLDKLNSTSSEDVDQLRYITAKIQHCLKDHEKVRKEVMSKTTNGLEVLFSTLESSKDSQVSLNVTYSLLELLQSIKRAQSMVARGATQVLLTALSTASKQQPTCEELIVGLHQVMAKVGPKDRKFGVKARLSGALPITLGIVRVNTGNLDLVQPMVQVLKIYSTNSVNSSHLGKAGAVSSLLKIISVCGKRHHPALRSALEALSLLVKSKSNSARAIGQGGMPILVHAFSEWQKADVRNRHISIRKGILNVIKNITTLKSGKKTFSDCDGIKVLFNAALSMASSSSKDIETIVNLICIILRKCFPKNRLPVPTIRSSVPFSLPVVPEGHTLLEPTSGDDVIDESDDQDDDVSSGDENKDEEPPKNEVLEGGEGDKQTSSEMQKRTPEDLATYLKFFPELTDFEEHMVEPEEGEVEDTPQRPGTTIHIPTAKSDLPRGNTRTGATQNLRENRFSLPNLSKYSNLVTNYHSGDDTNVDMTKHQSRQVPAGKANSNAWFSQDNEDTTTFAGHFNLGGSAMNTELTPDSVPSSFRTSAPRVSAKQSQSFHNLRRSHSPTKGTKHGNGFKYTSPERHINAHGLWGIGDEHPTESIDFVRSSMTISRMTLRSPTDGPSSNSEILMTEEVSLDEVKPDMYGDTLAKTKRVLPFRRIAHPEIHGHSSGDLLEEFYDKPASVQRCLVFEDIDRMIHPHKVMEKTVFDLDEIMKNGATRFTPGNNVAHNSRSGSDGETPSLAFNSLFECGNLRRAIQVRKHEYDLILRSDINSNHHHQWFYFEISGMQTGVRYRFNVINCEKVNSQFNYGMQPVMYSVHEAMEGSPHWARVGSEVAYYKNNYSRSTAATGGPKGKTYFTFAFTLTFKHEKDICYLAYHYPYSYTTLQVHLSKLQASLGEFSDIYFRKQSLCLSLGGNECPVLTITANPTTLDKEGVMQFRCRRYLFLSARVHPGESNSSFIMKGVLKFLMSTHPTAQALREIFIFKIVPMLNPDGVINGSHRCSLSGEDLNRRWLLPIKELHPTIYHTKGLLQYLHLIERSPLVYCDFHGHSRKKNVFMYGNSAAMSYSPDDLNKFGIPSGVSGAKVEDTSYKTLPRILSSLAPAFSHSNCSFAVDKGKESAARVVVWREMGVARSYTMESTYCGFDQGKYKGLQVSTAMLEEMGQHFCEGLYKLARRFEATGTAHRHLYNHTSNVTDPSSSGVTSTYPSAQPMDDDEEELVDGDEFLDEVEKAPPCERKRSHLMTDLKEELTPSENDEDDEEDEVEEEEEIGDVVFVYGLDDDSIPKIDRNLVEEMKKREEQEGYGYPKDDVMGGPL